MIKIEKTEVLGFEHAIRGMRNPMNSWDKSDSYPAIDCGKCGEIDKRGFCKPGEHDCSAFKCYEIGPNDHDLMMRLARNGSVHAKYRRMIAVYADITAPLYWWKEFDTYKVGTVANSCSTMHKIHAKEFTLEDFSYEHLDARCREILGNIVDMLNSYRELYVNYDPNDFEIKGCPPKKMLWWQMIQLLPSSYNQKRTVMLNYEVLAGIYPMRKDHKLDEWREFCKWIEMLPYSEIITCEAGKEG